MSALKSKATIEECVARVKRALELEGKILLGRRFLKWVEFQKQVNPEFQYDVGTLSDWLVDNGYPEFFAEDVWRLTDQGNYTSEIPEQEIIMATKKTAQDEQQYKSDEDIASEFSGMAIEDLTVTPKKDGSDDLSVSVSFGFPEGDEHVGGGSDTTVEWFTLRKDDNGNYKCEFLGFQNWYPDDIALEMFKLLEQKLSEQTSTEVYFVNSGGYNMIDRLEQSAKKSSKKTAMAKEDVKALGYDAGKQAAESVLEDNSALAQNTDAWMEAATAAESDNPQYSPLEFMTGAEDEGDALIDAYTEGVADGIYSIVYGKEKSMVATKKAAVEVDLAQVYKPGLAQEALKLIQSFGDLEDLSDEPGRYQVMVDTVAGGAVGRYQPAYAAQMFGIKDKLLAEIKEGVQSDPDSLMRISEGPITYDENSGMFIDDKGEEISNDEIIVGWEWSWETIEEAANSVASQLDESEKLPEPYDNGVWYFGHNENDGSYGLFYSWEMDEEQQVQKQD